jgi:glyoxylase-like metal-dependent hydrolase (beta-lactamase superfamily II)
MWNQQHYKYYDFQHIIEPSEISGITDVIITHLHFDHAGGLASRAGGTEEAVLNFPYATHHCHRRNWEEARNPSPRERASYLSSYLRPLQSASLNLLVDETSSIAGVAHSHVLNGHTEGLMWISIELGDTTYAFPSDLIPTSHHVSLPYIMGYDMCPRSTLKEKELFLTKSVENSWVVVFQHDPDIPAATITLSAKGDFIVNQVVSIDEYQSCKEKGESIS